MYKLKVTYKIINKNFDRFLQREVLDRFNENKNKY